MRHPEICRTALRAVCGAAVLLLAGCGQKGDLYIPETLQLLGLIVF